MCYRRCMTSSSLTRRTQLLLDDDLHRRLRETAAQRGISMGALIREAIDEKLSQVQDDRAKAIDKLLAAEPMPVDDWPVMKKQMLEDRYASVMRLLDTYD
jgi:plasmid stability protein